MTCDQCREADCDEPWKDEEVLENLYHSKDLSTREIAEKLGCSRSTVWRWMDRLGIERRDRLSASRQKLRCKPARFETKETGYERWRVEIDGVSKTVPVHRLLAVAEFGFEAVRDSVVHHKNGIKWANWHDNLEPLANSDHVARHHERGELDASHLSKYNEQRRNPDTEPYHDPEVLQRLYHDRGLSLRQVADRLGCDESTIRRHMDRHGISTRSWGTHPPSGGRSA